AKQKAQLYKKAEAARPGTTKSDDEYFQLALDNLRREKQIRIDYAEYIAFHQDLDERYDRKKRRNPGHLTTIVPFGQFQHRGRLGNSPHENWIDIKNKGITVGSIVRLIDIKGSEFEVKNISYHNTMRLKERGGNFSSIHYEVVNK
ncbi:MAG: hypothetical protein ABID45_01540, partial [Patescibacteria group bacterium]